MNAPFIQRLIATICLVAFGLGQTEFASMGVRCTDASGTSRIEYACIKSPAGACLTPSAEPVSEAAHDDHEEDPIAPAPCEDVPLGSKLSAARVISASDDVKLIFAEPAVGVLWDCSCFGIEQTARCARAERGRDRPPDALTRLRSVVLIV